MLVSDIEQSYIRVSLNVPAKVQGCFPPPCALVQGSLEMLIELTLKGSQGCISTTLYHPCTVAPSQGSASTEDRKLVLQVKKVPLELRFLLKRKLS